MGMVMSYPECKYREEGNCIICYQMSGVIVPVQPLTCRACASLSSPRSINQVTVEATVDHLHANNLYGPEFDFLTKPLVLTSGPGTAVGKLIGWFISKPPDCDCEDRIKIMNLWGADKCLKELSTIAGWLKESALDNNIPYNDYIVRWTLTRIFNSCKRHGQ